MNNEIRVSRKRNAKITMASMVAIFAIYILRMSNESESDNVGMLVMPVLLPLVNGPIISFTYAFLQTLNHRMETVSFTPIVGNILKRMPIFFRLTGTLGLALTLFVTFSGGIQMGLELLLFPFWAIG